MISRLRSRLNVRRGDSIARGATLAKIIENALWLLAGKGVTAVLSLVYLALATRSLGLTGFGQFVLILGLGQALVQFVSFQTWQIVVRYGLAPLRAGDDGSVGRLLGFCAALDLLGAVAGCLLAWIGTVVLAPYFHWSPEIARNALIFCVVMLLSIRSTPIGILRLFDRFGVGAIADSMNSVGRLVGAITVVWVGASVTGFLIAWGLAEMFTAIVYWLFALRIARPDLRDVRGMRAVAAEHAGLLSFAAVTNISSTLGTVSKQVAVLLVGLVAGPAAAGGYRIAHQLGQALARVSDMLARSMYAELNRASHGDDGADLKRLFRQASRLAIGGGLAIVAILLLIGKPALVLIAGAPYAAVYPLLLLLGTAAALDLSGVSFEPTLMATGRAGTALRLKLATAVAILILLACLMPLLGATGAAVATLCGSVIGLILLGTAARRAVKATV